MSAAERRRPGPPPSLAVTRDQVRADAERERTEFSDAELDAWTDRTWDRVQELNGVLDVDVCRLADRGDPAADILFQSWEPERRRKAAAVADRSWAASWAKTKPGRRS